MHNVYSFADFVFTISHPSVGTRTITGEGIGDIAFNLATDVTAHDIGSDGVVMISKIKAKNGTIEMNIQQSSAANNWLTKWYNYLEGANSGEWARSTVTARHTVSGESYQCTGVTPQKLPDRSYQAEGQRVTWSLMAAQMDYNAGAVMT